MVPFLGDIFSMEPFLDDVFSKKPFLEDDLDNQFPIDEYARVIAHPTRKHESTNKEGNGAIDDDFCRNNQETRMNDSDALD